MDWALDHNECRYKNYCTNHGHERCRRGYDLERYINCNEFREISYETKEFRAYKKILKDNGINV